MGKKDELLVEERQFFLDRFMRSICELPYLYESDELQTFLRPPAQFATDVTRALETMPRLTVRMLMPIPMMSMSPSTNSSASARTTSSS